MEREIELAGLVAQAHKLRAKERALKAARDSGTAFNVFRGAHGWIIDKAAPALEAQWNVATPAGEYLTVRRKKCA